MIDGAPEYKSRVENPNAFVSLQEWTETINFESIPKSGYSISFHLPGTIKRDKRIPMEFRNKDTAGGLEQKRNLIKPSTDPTKNVNMKKNKTL